MAYDDLYGGTPPHVDGSDTSEAAAEDIRSSACALREQVRSEIDAAGPFGRTCDEIEVMLGMRHQTASARIRELFLKNLILDSTLRRLTRSRRRAIVWVTPGHSPHKIINRALGQVLVECAGCERRAWHDEGGPYPCRCGGMA